MPLIDRTFSDIITFTRASGATYFDSAGVLQSAAINSPRFDYDPVTLAARGMLIEEQRTNTFAYSEQFDDAYWLKSSSTISANATTAPSGTAVADKLIENSGLAQHNVYRTVSGTTNTNPYTVSFFAKADTRDRIHLVVIEGGSFARSGYATFDLLAGTVVAAGTGAGGATGGSASIQAVGNGWYRCNYTLTLGGTDTQIYCEFNLVSSGTTIFYNGNGTSGLFLWGAQLEAGAFPTSYIPTTTAGATRAADVASVNTLSPWFNASEGTLFAELTQTIELTSALISWEFNDLTFNNRINTALDTPTAGNRRLSSNMFTGGVQQAQMFSATLGTTFKAAFAWQTDNLAASQNGSAVQTDTSATIPSVSRLYLGTRTGGGLFLNGHLRRIGYYKRRLSNAQLQAITQ